MPIAGQIAVCCQNLPLGALSSRSVPSVLVGALFKNFGLFLNTPHILCEIRADAEETDEHRARKTMDVYEKWVLNLQLKKS
jgi:hypothetical protein